MKGITPHYGLGEVYGRQGELQEAVEAFKEVIRHKPDYADAHFNLGWAYSVLGRFEEAIEPYKKAISLKPALAIAHYNLGSAYLRMGRYEEALKVGAIRGTGRRGARCVPTGGMADDH